ncbi:hypothetical protein NE865_10331 [Phthorimaea operculella]|nr:hypothetical protein NE865_10331 [Phthorimaea operculella]
MSKPDVAALKKAWFRQAKVTLFRKFIDNVKTIQSLNSVQLTELKNRLTEFKLVYPSFDETQTLIESIDDISEVDEVDPVREQFENDYHLLVAVATELIRKHDPEDSEYGTVTGSQRTPGGADDESSLLHIITKVNKALKSAQFPLRKWQSNHPDILHKAALNSDSSRNTLNLGTNDQSKH